MRENERIALARRTLELAGDGLVEAIVVDEDDGLTRFTQNAIHQNVAHRATSLRLRIVRDGRSGVVETNDLGDDGLRAAAARAEEIVALAPRDPEFPGLATAVDVAIPTGAFVTATAEASPVDRARIAADAIAASERAGLWAAGYVRTGRSGVTIANSGGALLSYDGTTCGLNVKSNGADASGYAEYFSTDVATLDGAASGSRAAEKARSGANPVPVEPGLWTVILEPAAFGELLSNITEQFSAQSYDEGSSFLCDGLDRSYAGERVSIADDFAHPLLQGMPFDYQGEPTRRVELLAHGVARNVVTDARWAKRLDRPNTGHGGPAPDAVGPQVRHVVVAPGSRSLDELIAETERGLLVSRFWYIRPVDGRKTIVTGMTRDGTFLIEGGKITRGVRNLRFNQSILEALTDAEFGDTAERTEGYAYLAVVPAVKIRQFHFTSVTDF
ncbi:MAG: TldD/PmbA family protein [Candidatus Eremiobacteraeota bacterium]|nr:TldD/PmbA family protein [Candidatus Eremiobacteraeota bacterium]